MKVNGANEIKQSRISARKKTGGGQSAFTVDTGQDTTGARHAQATSSLAAVDSLLALQEIGGEQQDGLKRGRDTLDLLDEIRDGLLQGSIPVGKLRELTRIIDGQRDQVADPGLAEVLDEIDLRAQVELAKYEHLVS